MQNQPMEFSQSFQVRWADVDANGHMRHSAYNDYAAQIRVAAFTHRGFPIAKLLAMQIGPVLFREETIFLREMGLLQDFTVNVVISAMRKNGKIWSMKHEFTLPSGLLAATIVVDGAWMSLKERKVTPPPEALLQMMENYPKSQDFVWLPESNK